MMLQGRGYEEDWPKGDCSTWPKCEQCRNKSPADQMVEVALGKYMHSTCWTRHARFIQTQDAMLCQHHGGMKEHAKAWSLPHRLPGAWLHERNGRMARNTEQTACPEKWK